MDPYEYLFKKLGVKIIDFNCTYTNEIMLWFKNRIVDRFNLKITAKNIFRFYTNDDIICESSNSELIKELIMILRQFPAKLESKEHVDLLLTLHGMN